MALKRLLRQLRSIELLIQSTSDLDEQMRLQAEALELGKSVKQLGV